MFKKYIDILSDCSKNILKQMGNIDISDVTIKQEKSLSTTYSIAHSIHYEDSKNKLKGDFILGFVDESEAIHIAAAIAENIGLPPIEKIDEIAPDVINEFLNTVVGHTTTECSKNGLYVSFSPPAVSRDKKINISDTSNTTAYLISLGFAPGMIKSDFKAEELSLMVTLTKNSDNELLGKRILVVDDSMVMRKIISEALKKSGVEVQEAGDGQEAMEKYKIFKPDLTIIDLVMPKMNGLDAIVEIQNSNPEAKFIIVTSTSRRDEIVTAKSLNVLSYLVKPLKMEDLLVKVKEAFKKNE
jgi:CheY-like chemotaxis protein/CheY-specific phosphatase CheX